MKSIRFIAFAVLAIAGILISGYIVLKKEKAAGRQPLAQTRPLPTEGEENEELRERYNELRHRTAPGTDWEKIEADNARAAYQLTSQTGNISARTTETFAGGAISGDWSEKGAANQAGSIRAIDYLPATNTLYTISNGGSLWKSILGSGAWTLLNQGFRFDQRNIQAFTKTGGGTRILAAIGQNLMYSDNDGATFTATTGISFPVAWGGNYVAKIIRLNDGSNTIYCLTRPWSSNPWGPRFWLYRSTDQGASYSKLYEFTVGDDDRVTICNPYNSNNVYIADVATVPGSIRTYQVSGTAVNITGTFAAGTTAVASLLKATTIAGTTTMYLLNANNKIYRTTDAGANWELRSTLPEAAWNKMNVSMNDADAVSFGGVNAFRSSNGGTSFTKVNNWDAYYNNVPARLHADIMEIEYFKRPDNTEFAIVNTHGGTYLSYDNLLAVANQSLSSHLATEYYDVLTDTINNNHIFVGTQDQGLQRTLTGNATGPQNFQQVISGDYGQLSLTANNQFLWPQYPGGVYYLYTNLGNVTGPSYIGQWSMTGTQKPNVGWMLAATSTATASSNKIWIGGGNITGGSGSYLINLSLPTVAPYTVTPTQIDYNFRVNSNSGTAGITAIEQSLLDSNRMFVATEDGTFFYSPDMGATWTKSAAFTGPTPWYLYGSCILASRKNADVLWYAGSGYNNPAVYKSTNGGVSFTAMSAGLPNTLVNEIVATPAEDFLFAATEAGPYVYVAAANQWYPLISNNMPIQFYSSVEYISATKTVRFGTMGRGIWDFKITSALPVSLLQFTAARKQNEALLNWSTATESNSSHFIIERSLDGRTFTPVGQVTAAGTSNVNRAYSFTDDLAAINRQVATIYYRLQMVDKNGDAKTSRVVSIKLAGSTGVLTLLGNPVRGEAVLQYQSTVVGKITLRVIDASGKMVMQIAQSAVAGVNSYRLNTAPLAKGVYTVQILNAAREVATSRIIKE